VRGEERPQGVFRRCPELPDKKKESAFPRLMVWRGEQHLDVLIGGGRLVRSGDCADLRNHHAKESIALAIFSGTGLEETLEDCRFFSRSDSTEFAEN